MSRRISETSAVLQNLNPMLNIVLYVVREKALRAAVLGLLSGKTSIPTANTVVPTQKITVNAANPNVEMKANVPDVD